MGAVTAAIGAVTGNQKLIKIGSIIGIAGAVGGFASSAGLFGDAAAAGATDAATQVSGNPTGFEGNTPIGTPPGETTTTTGGTGMSAQPTTPVTPPVDTPTPTVPPQPASEVVPPEPNASPLTAPPATASNLGGAAPTAPDPTAPVDTNAATGTYMKSDGTTGSATSNDAMTQFTTPTTFDKLMGTFNSLGKYAKDNPMITSSILSGISSAADPSQRNLRDAQANSLNTNAAMTAQMMQNQKGVGGIIDWSKVFPGGIKPVAPSGMISAARGG